MTDETEHATVVLNDEEIVLREQTARQLGIACNEDTWDTD